MDDFFDKASSEYARSMYSGISIEDLGKGFVLGKYNTYHLLSDPKRVGFLFARYKFVAKMLEGMEKVLEIGCQEGLGTIIVAKSVKQVVGVDFYKPHIESCNERMTGLLDNVEFKGHDIIEGPVKGGFSAAYSLDVLEHIDPLQECRFMENVVASLTERGVFIVGMPSLESQVYASETSKAGHINCKSGPALRDLCRKYFYNVFMFGMNDEVLHTGYFPMCHYLIALCAGPRPLSEK